MNEVDDYEVTIKISVEDLAFLREVIAYGPASNRILIEESANYCLHSFIDSIRKAKNAAKQRKEKKLNGKV